MADSTHSVDLEARAAELLTRARAASNGRATQVFHAAPGGTLSVVLLALTADHELAEHENPGEAFLHVLDGHVRLSAGPKHWELRRAEQVPIPQRRHSLRALTDSVVLLTIARVSNDR